MVPAEQLRAGPRVQRIQFSSRLLQYTRGHNYVHKIITTLFRAASPSSLGGRGHRVGSGSV